MLATSTHRLIARLTWLVGIAWTLTLGGSLLWTLRNAERETMDTAYATARANLDKDITLRRWATDHGGVYVPITEQQQSVPWLSHVPGRDVVTTGGLRLTLLNPASVVRQMMDRYAVSYGVRGRITGLKYLNPGNAPDAWEKRQLETFTRGEGTEVWDVTELDGKPHLRYLRAMVMEPGCEKCHAILGYKPGDMRGATGLNLPLAPYLEKIDEARRNLGLTHGAIWLLGFGGIALSSTMAQRRERELRQSKAIVDSTDDAIISKTLDGIVTSWNPGAAKIFGYAAEEAIGNSMRPLLPEDRLEEESAILARIALGERIEHFVTARRCKDGRSITISATISPITNERGKVVGASAIARDITESKKAETEIRRLNADLEERVRARTAALETANASLAQAKETAEAANVAKSAFLANMSHEIRTPMNGILGMAHILRRGGVTQLQAERLDKIDASARHLLNIIDDILDLSKIEAGKLVLEEAAISVAGLMANVSSILSDRASEKGIRLLIEQNPLPLNLMGDPTRLQQALLNYANNAIKFTESGTVTLRSLKLHEDVATVLLRFEVGDTGIGISPEALSRLFNAFEQADNSTTRKYGGTGLGLAITRRMAKLMGGEVGAESEPGVGSTFWFTARLRKGAAAPPRDEVADGEAETLIRQGYPGGRILVVDDEPINQDVTRTMLEDAGLVVDTADDGEMAVALARRIVYAAIFMDMQMPRMNGIEATRVIRDIPGYRETPIIAMTANVFADDKAKCLEAGMNVFLIKPFRPDALFSVLLRSLARGAGQQADGLDS